MIIDPSKSGESLRGGSDSPPIFLFLGQFFWARTKSFNAARGYPIGYIKKTLINLKAKLYVVRGEKLIPFLGNLYSVINLLVFVPSHQ